MQCRIISVLAREGTGKVHTIADERDQPIEMQSPIFFSSVIGRQKWYWN